MERKPKGTAGMTPEVRKKVAQAGGRAVSRDRRHMSVIGKLGGIKISNDKAYMSMLGKRGAEANAAKRKKAVQS